MVYLEGWQRVLKRKRTGKASAIVLEDGPIFRLALLRESGARNAPNEPFESWWNRMLDRWRSTLDMIVLLDAPDPILFQRIQLSDDWHRVKGRAEREPPVFLAFALCRKACSEIIAGLTAKYDPLLLRFDTNRNSPDDISTAVLDKIGSRHAKVSPPLR